MVRGLLSDGDRERIEAAIGQIEQRSSLEVVVAVLRRSADYWQWRVALAGSWALAAACAILHFLPRVHPLWAVLAELPSAILVFLAFGTRPLHRLLIPGAYSERSVQARAFQLFAERGLHHTRERTGLLLLVSELEHRVVILGDSGLHAQVGERGWQSHVDALVKRIRTGETVTGILELLARIEASASGVMPVRSDDVNELPNTVIEN
jgi:putative membrane protein